MMIIIAVVIVYILIGWLLSKLFCRYSILYHWF